MTGVTQQFEFDFAISFAGEDRSVAEQLAHKLKEKGVAVFYDHYYKSRLLGEKLGREFRTIYGPATRFFVPIISKYYIQKDYTNYEWTIAKEEEKRRNYKYILPLRLDESRLVGLHSDVRFADLRVETLDTVVESLLEKLQMIELPLITSGYIWWVATVGLVVEEVVEQWNLPDSVPRTYVDLCDWLEKDLEYRLQKGGIKGVELIEDSRNGESLSVRFRFKWSPSECPLDFGPLEWWQVLEILPFESVYPDMDQRGQ